MQKCGNLENHFLGEYLFLHFWMSVMSERVNTPNDTGL